MAKCSLCGSEIRFGQSIVLSSFDGKICPKCQQEITKKKTQSNGCDLNYLNTLLTTATTERNKNAVREILDMPYDPPVDIEQESATEDLSCFNCNSSNLKNQACFLKLLKFSALLFISL